MPKLKSMSMSNSSHFFFLIRILLFFHFLLFITNCGSEGGSGGGLSILPEEESFLQNATFTKRQIDILWVIDNSGSMLPYQKRLQKSFDSFINRFQTLNYDFHIAVIATDAYRGGENARWSAGGTNEHANQTGISGYRVINSKVKNLKDVFLKNVAVGTDGDGNERPLQSLRVALKNSNNEPFYRKGSFLSIIVLSDEKDSSDEPISSYIEFLNKFTQSTSSAEYYSISIISAMKTSSCLRRPFDSNIFEAAEKTEGIKVDICENNYDPHLKLLSDTVIELSTFFPLKRQPVKDSIVVTVNGEEIPKSKENGWSYGSKQNGIFFHGTAVPSNGDSIDADYTPEDLEI